MSSGFTSSSNCAAVTSPDAIAASFSETFFSYARLRDLRRRVVADERRERRHQHERVAHVARDRLAVRLDADDAVLAEAVAGVGEQIDALEEIVDEHRLEHVELEVPARAGDADADVVAHHVRRTPS